MQSQGSTSTQPSFDSLSSSDSFLFSDSEQAEDDTDVFLTDSSPSVIIGGGGGVRADRDRGPESPESQWTCDSFTDREEEGESDRSESRGGGHLRAEEMETAKQSPKSQGDMMFAKQSPKSQGDMLFAKQSPKSQGDMLFAQKCAELQGFVRPLLELLHGLKRGRFDRGLSTFQQSVAMDRIQRIVGVLQRPNSGEKYLNTLLQVEMMLKMWFPQISACSADSPSSAAAATTSTKSSTSPDLSSQDTPSCTPPHKHRDQLHIPVKKRRLSWTDTDSPTPSPVLLKNPHTNGDEKRRRRGDGEGESPSPSLEADPLQSSREPHKESEGRTSDGEESKESPSYKAGPCSEPSLTWVHVAPILSPPKACPPHEGPAAANEDGKLLLTGVLPPASKGSSVTQDSSVSSTTPKTHPKKSEEANPVPNPACCRAAN